MKAQYLIAVPAFLLFMACNDRSGMNTINDMDRNFVARASNENLATMDNGRLAVANSDNSRVRQIGQLAVDESGTSQVGLQQAAQQADIPVMQTPGTDKQAQRAQLQTLTGYEFDKAVVEATLASYQETVELYEMQANTGIDKGLKAYAKDRLPILKQQLDKMRELSYDY